MDEELSKYGGLIQRMEATPKAPVPKHFTETVMSRLSAEQNLNAWQLLRQSIVTSGEIPWDHFTRENAQGRNAGFYFLITGLFFFFIGTIIFSSMFFIEHIFRVMGPILMQAILIIMAAILLVAAGMIMVADIPGAARWAKRATMLFGLLILANSMLINVTVKTTSGGVLAITFGIVGIVAGTILMKTLEKQTQRNKGNFTGGFHNALQ